MEPGWYPDTTGDGTERYFDGTTWTDRDRPTLGPLSSPQPVATHSGPLVDNQRTSGFAVASLVTALLGLSLVAIVLGHLARRQIRESVGAERGSGLALAGLIIGYGQIAIVAVVLLVAGGLTFGSGAEQNSTGGSRDEVSDEPNSTAMSREEVRDEPTSTVNLPPPAQGADLPEPPSGLTLTSPTECPPTGGATERVQTFAGPPPMCIDPGATYSATFSTSEGKFTATLDAAAAPETVNNFVVLARYRYYDGVPFHRVVPGFVIQAGDGDGEPWGNNDIGYQIDDELPADSSAYRDYSLAMANSGPDTNGSQFFVVLPGASSELQPLYSILGRITVGTEVIDAIGALGTSAGEEPRTLVLIDSVTVTEG